MSQNSKTNHPQEIDLLDLFSKIGNGIKNLILGLLKAILFIILFGVRKIHFLLLFAIAGGIIGFVLYRSTQRYYSSNMVAQPNGITSSDMINYINDLHELCKKNNVDALALDLQMSDSMARKIKDIQAYFIIDVNKDDIGDYVDFKNTFILKDTTQQRLENRIHVTVEVYNNQAFENVRNGLFRYMRKNPYLIKLNEIRKDELERLIFQTDYEIRKLDSLQNTDYFQKNTNQPIKESQLMFFSDKERKLYHIDKLDLLKKQQEYQKELELATDAFTVIKDFTSLAVAENPKGIYLFRYGFMFFVVGYLLLLILKFRRRIFDFIKT